ncbi:28151_t:CDS:2, partial [Racocetra persica]
WKLALLNDLSEYKPLFEKEKRHQIFVDQKLDIQEMIIPGVWILEKILCFELGFYQFIIIDI